jgi:hypothetical protein
MNKLSSLFEYQVPSYAHEDYPVFVAFMKNYFEWLEETGNVNNFLQNYHDNIDIDLSNDEFVVEFMEEFVELLPKEKKINDKTLIKYIREFYIAKGSEQSFRFIFRILYDVGITIIYPREYLFKTSDAIYDGDVYLRTTAIRYDILDLTDPDVNIYVTGRTSGSIAIVDSITRLTLQGVNYIELELSSYDHDFIINEQVEITVNEQVIVENTIGGIVGMVIDDGGNDVQVDDDVIIGDIVESYPEGFNFFGTVSNASSGAFDQYTINDAGTGYIVGDFVYAVPVTENVNGFGYIGQVNKVGSGGEIEAIEIVNSGGLYFKKTEARVTSVAGSNADITLSGSNIGTVKNIAIDDSGVYYDAASDLSVYINDVLFSDISPQLGCVFTSKKHYFNEKGFTSHNSRILDSHYYQQFSYALKSTVPPSNWIGIVKRLAHPSGSELFAIWENTLTGFVGLTDLTSKLLLLIQIISEMVGSIPTTTASLTKEIEHTNYEACNATYNLSDLDFIKFSSLFLWTIGYFADVSINDLETKCQDDLNKTNDTKIIIDTV